MNPQDLFNEIGRYLDSKSQKRFGFAVAIVDSETQIVSLLHVSITQEVAVELCRIVGEHENLGAFTQIPRKEDMT